ncbi:probable transcriptional regulator SLK2 isoform X2 [Andrographis paniculata]|uniref:probable transcriptional regulator SLK2 isoform X2 n=1 Tax=Andrographis paniculata TaxID=175694 RepID=UPI0021E96E8D|nr:probable transcriptional regulator SLK2 isoform X2 [Andrographis paniculata]
MVPSRVAGGMPQSSSSSGIFFQPDGQSEAAGNARMATNYGNSLHSVHGSMRANMGQISGDVNNMVLNGVASSGPSIGTSSLVTDANSGLSGGPHMQRSASFNTDSYARLPASPMSFTSNNISISGSSAIDGSSMLQQGSNQEQGIGASSVTSSRIGQVPIPGGARVPNSLIQDPTSLSHLQKKPRLDIKQEDILQQQVLQQLLQRQDPSHLQNLNPQLQSIIQQQRLRHQQQREQQLLQSMPPVQRMQLLQQQQQQQQLRQQLLQQGMQPSSGIKRPFDGGVCSRRLMQYMYHQRQRPTENTIAYWRKFVVEYYSPRAKKRWCLSLYDSVGHHSLGVFPQASMDAWQCDICNSKSGKGFEATFEVLPRLNEIKFGSGVVDELLFLDLPRESRFPSGMMMLEYGKAIQESVFEQLRVVREGQLRIIFTADLKILSWEFCARRHEELLPRRLIAPQVNHLLQVAQKCQSTISESGSEGVSQSDLQASSVMVVTAGRQLARSLELQSLNDLGFSKRYVRCLQIAEVVNSMKDLMDFCKEQKVGPVEGLKNFPGRASAPKIQMQKTQETEPPQNDRNALNKLMTNNGNMASRGVLTGSAQAALALSNNQNILMRQSSSTTTTSTHNSSHAQEASASAPSGISPAGGFSGSQAMQQRQNSTNESGVMQQQQQMMIQQMLQEMNSKNNGSEIPHGAQNKDGLPAAGSRVVAAGGGGGGELPSNNNRGGAGGGNGESPVVSHSGFGHKVSDLAQDIQLPDEFVSDVAQEFVANGFFSSELDDNMSFSWKA